MSQQDKGALIAVAIVLAVVLALYLLARRERNHEVSDCAALGGVPVMSYDRTICVKELHQ